MENEALPGGVIAVRQSGLILENIRRMFLLSIWATGTMYINFDEKHSPNVLENQTRLQNRACTTRKNLFFRKLCALFEQIPSGINREFLKNHYPTGCGAKNSNKLCTVIWSRGFPTLYSCKMSYSDHVLNSIFKIIEAI